MLDKLRFRVQLFFLRRIRRSPSSVIDKWQNARLKQLVEHATRRVPLYREYARNYHVGANSVRSTADLGALPILTRADFSGKPPEAISDSSSPRLTPWLKIDDSLSVLMSDLRASRAYVQLPATAGDTPNHRALYHRKEFGIIASECAEHEGVHAHSELFIVEVIDDSGSPAADGQRGRILVTDLFNYNMPFIRYDTGDTARISHATCTCGLSTPRLWLERSNARGSQGQTAVFISEQLY